MVPRKTPFRFRNIFLSMFYMFDIANFRCFVRGKTFLEDTITFRYIYIFLFFNLILY